MLKWQFMALTEFDVVLHVDTDIDVMPIEMDPIRIRHLWQSRLELFVSPRWRLSVDSIKGGKGAGMRLLGVADHSSPLNGGLLMLRPSTRLYADGLRVIRHCQINRTHGWGRVGRPRSLSLTPRFFSLSAGGSTKKAPYLNANGFYFVPLNETVAYLRDDWNFVAGAEDQGFLWYMLFIRHDLGVYLHDMGHTQHYMFHYWGQIAGSKAWEGQPWTSPAHMTGQCSKRLGANLYYLSRLESDPELDRAPCMRSMTVLRRSAEAHPLAITPKGSAKCIRWKPPRIAIW